MEDQFSIVDKVIVITGGSGTLGGALADHLIMQGSRLVIIGSREESVAKKMADLSTHEDRVLGLAVDVTNEQKVIEAHSKILDRMGRIDVLINAGGWQCTWSYRSSWQVYF